MEISILTGNPKRDERLGWNGDVQNFFRTWLRNLAAEQFETDGVNFNILSEKEQKKPFLRGDLGAKVGKKLMESEYMNI